MGVVDEGGDDRRSAAITLLEDFEQIVAGAGVEGLKAEVVKEEEIGAAEGFDQAWMAAVATAERQILAELRPAMVQDGSIVAASSVADGASQPTFPDAGWADQGQVVAGFDPVALCWRVFGGASGRGEWRVSPGGCHPAPSDSVRSFSRTTKQRSSRCGLSKRSSP